MSVHLTQFGSERARRVFFGVHGWGSSGPQSFEALAAHLPSGARLIAPDLPGCGQSEAIDPWSIEAVHEVLFEAFERATSAEERVTLVGSCSGSYHVLPLAEAYPERVSHVVLLEPFAFMPWYFSIFLKPVTGRALYTLVFNNPVGRAATRRSLRRQGGDPRAVDMIGAFGTKTGLDSAYAYLKHYATITDHAVFRGVEQPVRAICGERSFRAVQESLTLWRELWPGLDAQILQGVGHMLSQEAPEHTARLIFEWA